MQYQGLLNRLIIFPNSRLLSLSLSFSDEKFFADSQIHEVTSPVHGTFVRTEEQGACCLAPDMGAEIYSPSSPEDDDTLLEVTGSTCLLDFIGFLLLTSYVFRVNYSALMSSDLVYNGKKIKKVSLISVE